MRAQVAAAAAVAATGAYAQSVSYTTVTYDDCPSSTVETMITITNGVTITYCPTCEGGSDMPTDMSMTPSTGAGPASTKPTGPGLTTTYTTTYMSLCSTGTVPATYTVTESCEEPTPTWTHGPSHIPPGFTVTEKECTVCGETPTTVTLTEPCDCDSHEGTPAPNPSPQPTGPGGYPPGGETPCDGTPGCGTPGGYTPDDGTPSGETPEGETPGGYTPGDGTPGGSDGGECTQIGDGQLQCPPIASSTPAPGPGGECTQIGDGQLQCPPFASSTPAPGGECTQIGDGQLQCPPGGGSTPVPSSGGVPPPYPTATPSEGAPMPSGGGAPPPSDTTGMMPVPSTGGAASFSQLAFASSTFVAVIVAALAFAL